VLALLQIIVFGLKDLTLGAYAFDFVIVPLKTAIILNLLSKGKKSLYFIV
jgi:hypothetical protein